MKILEFYKHGDNNFSLIGKEFLSYICAQTVEKGCYWLVCLKAGETRTLKQNAYYWAVLITPIADYIGEKPELIHNEFKVAFLGTETKQRYDFGSGLVVDFEQPKSTTKLSKSAFTKYCTSIKDFAIQTIGVDFGFEEYEYFIEHHPEVIAKYAHKEPNYGTHTTKCRTNF